MGNLGVSPFSLSLSLSLFFAIITNRVEVLFTPSSICVRYIMFFFFKKKKWEGTHSYRIITMEQMIRLMAIKKSK
jgi:hypothetical protein